MFSAIKIPLSTKKVFCVNAGRLEFTGAGTRFELATHGLGIGKLVFLGVYTVSYDADNMGIQRFLFSIMSNKSRSY